MSTLLFVVLILAPLCCLSILFFDNFALYLVFSLLFTEGIVELLGIPPIFIRVIESATILLIFVKALYCKISRNANFEVFGLKTMLSLLAVAVLSLILNGSITDRNCIIGFALYFRLLFIHYILFLAVLNLSFSEAKVNNLIKFWVLIQLPSVLLKWAILGQSESGAIGTLSVTEGSISTIFPMFVSSFFLAYYLFRRNLVYLLLIIGFLLFAIIGGKRAVAFTLPLTLLAVLLLYSITGLTGPVRIKRILIGLVFFVVFGLICFYGVARLLPHCNPDGESGGSFDAAYALSYIQSYLMRSSTTNPMNVSRYHAFVETVSLMSKHGLHNLLGFGPGQIILSRFLPHDEFPLWDKYGIGYGGRTGLIWLWIQTGLLSIVLYWTFHAILFQRVYYFCKSDNTRYKIVALGFLGAVAVALMDFFLYSHVMISFGFLAGTYFYVAAILLRRDLVTTNIHEDDIRR